MLNSGTQTAQNIRRDTDETLENEDIELMRNLRTNINFVSEDTEELSIAFPDDVSNIAFDNVTIESEFASVTVKRDYIREGSEISVRRISEEALQAGLFGKPGSFLNAITDFSSPLTVLRNFWAVLAVMLLTAAWLILARFGKKLRVWVVPVLSVILIGANLGIVLLGIDTTIEMYSANGTIIYNDTDDNVIEVSMTDGMRATLSLPANSENPEFLVLFNEQDEPQFSRYNPVTDNIDARIRTSGVYTLREHTVSFADIGDKSQLMQDAILRLASKGIMRGTEDGYFNPDDLITRAEFVAAIVMAFDMLDLSAQTSFTDISPNDWYYQAIATAERERLIEGFPDNTFRGDLDIPKDQLVVIAANTLMERMGYVVPSDTESVLLRYLDRPLLAEWSEDGIALATASNVVIHRADSLFAPQSVKTRGDAAVVLDRVFSRVW
jgi:hypothetical protein